eukprot:g8114.t1
MDGSSEGVTLLRGGGHVGHDVAGRKRTLRRARTRFWQQLRALLLKNWLVQWRARRLLLLFVLSPALAVWLIALIKAMAYSVSSGDARPVSLDLERCAAFDVYGQRAPAAPCVTVAFAPMHANPLHTLAMRRLAANAGLRYGRDVLGFASAMELARQMRRRVGWVESAVVFPEPDAKPLAYELWYNKSAAVNHRRNGRNPLLRRFGVEGRTVAVQAAVDAALIEQLQHASAAGAAAGGGDAGGDGAGGADGVRVRIRPSAVSFPQKFTIVERERQSDIPPVVQLTGAPLMVGGWGLAAALVLQIAAAERRQKLLGTMRLMGLSEAAHWLSWLLFFTPLTALAAIAAVLAGRRAGVHLFTLSDWRLLLALHFAFGLAMVAAALYLAATTRSSVRAVNFRAFLMLGAAVLSTCALNVGAAGFSPDGRVEVGAFDYLASDIPNLGVKIGLTQVQSIIQSLYTVSE